MILFELIAMKLRYLIVIFLIAIYLIGFELALEYRAMSRGFSAHFVDQLKTNKKHNTKKNTFPFRSPPIEIAKTAGDIRFWMASASYAEDPKRKIDELFPNVFCSKIRSSGIPCQMINAAKGGYTIHDNIQQLKNEGRKWNPDYVLLYSMNLDISALSRQYLGNNSSNVKEVNENNKSENKTDNLSFGERIEKEVEYTTVYGHLRRYIGGAVLLSSQLYGSIGDKATNAFKQELLDFIQACRDIGAKPILVTFATKYIEQNYKDITQDDKTWFVRYNEYLSPKGWIKTVNDFNEVIRQTAIENNVLCIDVANTIAGIESNFTDYVHFTKNGHKFMGKNMAIGFLNADVSYKGMNP